VLFEDSPEILARFSAELELVDVVVRQLAREIGPLLEIDEMQSFGREGLLEAARRFEPDRGIPFRRYANFRVRGRILDGMRSSSKLSRRSYERVKALQAACETSESFAEDTTAQLKLVRDPALADDKISEQLAAMATAMVLGFGPAKGAGEDGEVIAVEGSLGPDCKAEQSELYETLRAEIQKLPEFEQKLIRRHYFDDVQLDVAAKELGLSKSWGSRILARALCRLSKRFSQIY
jgi:RNA polymerase sigma factor for flagellar operon FliA